MTIDISKICPGDKVTLVPLEVEKVFRAAAGNLVVVKLSKSSTYTITESNIAAHHPAPREIGVGDRVRVRGSLRVATVRAVDNGQAWVRWNDSDGEGNYTYLVSDLTLVEGDQ